VTAANLQGFHTTSYAHKLVGAVVEGVAKHGSRHVSTRATGEMADALASGASVRKDVGVQVPLAHGDWI
jgi:hypothetical protein